MKTILIKILAILICISLSVPGAVAFADSENTKEQDGTDSADIGASLGSKGVYDVYVDGVCRASGEYTAKAFLWHSETSLSPVCEEKEILFTIR